MPAHTKDPKILEFNGAFKHDPARERGKQVKADDPNPISLAPPEARIITFEEAWADVLSMCPDGVLRQRDTGMVAEAARCWMYQRNTITLHRMQGNPLPGADNAAQRQFVAAFRALGLSPTDCQRVALPKPVAVDGDFD